MHGIVHKLMKIKFCSTHADYIFAADLVLNRKGLRLKGKTVQFRCYPRSCIGSRMRSFHTLPLFKINGKA